MNNIIAKIKKRRTDLDMSYQELANKTGLSKSTLQRYETGAIKNMPIDKLEVLAEALDISPAYLMGWEQCKEIKTNNISNFTQEEILHIEDIRLLNEIGKKKVITYTKDLTEMSKYQKENNLTQISNKKTSNSDIKTIAAHNDHLTENGEMGKIIQDIEDMDNW